MFKYFKMKKLERDIKYSFYSVIAEFIRDKEETLNLLQNLYISLKGVPVEDLREELIKTIAEYSVKADEKSE